MTETVADLVLKDNYEQSETLVDVRGAGALACWTCTQRFIRALEQHAKLDRRLEALPDDEEIAERARERRGLTRPELAVLLAYSKVFLYAELLDSNVPEDPYLSHELERYFPPPLPERYPEQMHRHRLHREIIATEVVNNVLHGGGTTFAFRLNEETGAPPSEIARAYAVAREVFDMRPQWQGIEALDKEVRADVQTSMLLEGRRLIERGSRWLLRNRRAPMDIASTVERYRPGAAVLYEKMSRLLDPDDLEPLAAPGRRAARCRRPRGAGGAHRRAPAHVRRARRGRGGGRQRTRRAGRGGRALPARQPAGAALGARADRGAAARGSLAGDGARCAARRSLHDPSRAHRRGAARRTAPGEAGGARGGLARGRIAIRGAACRRSPTSPRAALRHHDAVGRRPRGPRAARGRPAGRLRLEPPSATSATDSNLRRRPSRRPRQG